MNDIGKIIQEKRESKSLDISSISSTLNLRQEFIIAMEEGNKEVFSSEAYYFGYLKQYLKLLNIEEVDNKRISSFVRPELAINIPSVDQFSPSLLCIVFSIFASFLIYNFADNSFSKKALDPITIEISNYQTRLSALDQETNSHSQN
ncbi:MAG: helix-turn-helix domain-containing protein [Pseudomonadota bacterium]